MGNGGSSDGSALVSLEVDNRTSPTGAACALVLPAVEHATGGLTGNANKFVPISGRLRVRAMRQVNISDAYVTLRCSVEQRGKGSVRGAVTLLERTVRLHVPGMSFRQGEQAIPFTIGLHGKDLDCPPSMDFRLAREDAACKVSWTISAQITLPTMLGFISRYIWTPESLEASLPVQVRIGQLPEARVLVSQNPFYVDSGFAFFRNKGMVDSHVILGAHRCHLPGDSRCEVSLYLNNSSSANLDLRSVKLVQNVRVADVAAQERKWKLEPSLLWGREETFPNDREGNKIKSHAQELMLAGIEPGSISQSSGPFGAPNKSTVLRMYVGIPLNVPLESCAYSDKSIYLKVEYHLVFSLGVRSFFGKVFKVSIPLSLCSSGTERILLNPAQQAMPEPCAPCLDPHMTHSVPRDCTSNSQIMQDIPYASVVADDDLGDQGACASQVVLGQASIMKS